MYSIGNKAFSISDKKRREINSADGVHTRRRRTNAKIATSILTDRCKSVFLSYEILYWNGIKKCWLYSCFVVKTKRCFGSFGSVSDWRRLRSQVRIRAVSLTISVAKQELSGAFLSEAEADSFLILTLYTVQCPY